MSVQRLLIFVHVVIASCHASGIGHLVPALPVVKSFPIVRYAPFFNFPNAGRSIHAVAQAPFLPTPPVLPAPAPLLPAPAPVFSPQAFHGPAIPQPLSVFAPAPFPAPVLPAPAYPAPSSLFTPALPRLAPLIPSLPRIAPFVPALPRLAPIASAFLPAPLYTRVTPTSSAAPFSPIIRPIATALPAPVFGPAPASLFAPAPVAVAKALPFGFQAYGPQIPYAPGPAVRQVAWK